MERLQHWFQQMVTDPRRQITAVWFQGLGKPQEKHLPLVWVTLFAAALAALTLWNLASIPVLWKEWRTRQGLDASISIANDGVVTMVVNHENLPLNLELVQKKESAASQFVFFDQKALLAPFTLLFDPHEKPLPYWMREVVVKEPVVAEINTAPVNDVIAEAPAPVLAEITKDAPATVMADTTKVASAAEPEKAVKREQAALRRWKARESDAGLKVTFQVKNLANGKLRGYVWGIATFEAQTGEKFTVTIPDGLASTDGELPNDPTQGESFGTKKFRNTDWLFPAPTNVEGSFTAITIGLAGQDGEEILVNRKKL